MNHDEILKVRAERIKSFRAASGGGTSGVVPVGMAAFLLAISRSRTKTLLASGRLETIAQGGQRWVLLASVCSFAEESLRAAVSKSDTSKSDTSKVGTSKVGTSKVGMSKAGTSKRGASKSDASKMGTI
jgi:uncharacterized low-complexity protein